MGLVMQEPILFNYSISENILYGNMNSKNSDIKEAATIANALEFIDSNNIQNAFDDSAKSLFDEWERNKDKLLSTIESKEYETMLQELKLMIKKE